MRLFVIGMVLILGMMSLGCQRQRLHTESQFLMGTIIEVTSADSRASKIVFDEMKRIESIFSIYKEDSLISKLNKNGEIDYNQEIASLVKKSLKFYRLTGGRFDVTIGPLVKLWKNAIKVRKIPTKEEIKDAMELVGSDKLVLTKDKIQLNKQRMILDFGAFAKGYAVDQAIKKLKENGINSAIVNVGGDTYCLGSKFGKPWKVGIRHPRNTKRIIETLEISDAAVVTSGDYEQFVVIEGNRYSHIINPRSGYPVDKGVVSVTIVADSCIIADAVATSVFLLGKKAGLRIFEEFRGIERIVVFTDKDL